MSSTYNNTSSGRNQNRSVFNVVGQRGIPSMYSYALATGAAKFARDVVIPGMLFGKALRSPYARATITSMDTTAAAALPGVRAVIRWDDPDIQALPPLNSFSGMVVDGTLPALSADAYFEGDEVGAVVAADSEEICDQALALIMANTKWNVLPFVLDEKSSYASGAPILNPDLNSKNNVYSDSTTSSGSVTNALASSDYTIEYTQSYPPVPYHLSDPATGVYYWDQDQTDPSSTGPDLHVQDVMSVAFNYASEFKIPGYKVYPHDLTQYMGPQYCCFIQGIRYMALGPLLAKRTGKPVRMAQDRRESFDVAGAGAHFDITIGFNKDGTLQAANGTMLFNTGARGGNATAYNMNSYNYFWMGPVGSKTPNIASHSIAVWTAMARHRNGLDTASQMVHAQAFYRMAEKLGKDPTDLVLLNFNTPNSSLSTVIANGKKALNWQWHQAGTKKLPDGRMHGYGFRIKDVAVAGTITYHINLILKSDGKVYMPIGEGHFGTFFQDCCAMVIAEELGASLGDVIVSYDPNTMEWNNGTARDRGAGMPWAAKEAAIDLKAKLLAAAAPSFGSGVTAAQLDTKNSTVYLISDPTKNFPFSKFGGTLATDFIGKCDAPNTSLAPGTFPTMNAIFCEVAVDTQTGVVEVLDWAAACDAGKVIRPSSFEGQIEQPLMNMTGVGLYQEMIRDPQYGVLLNGDTLGFMPPTILDLAPISIQTTESRMGTGCYGGVAQAHQIFDRVTIPLAVYNAIGKWIDPPITPDKVLAALGTISASSVRTTGGIET
jgi:CO/xanthine dehydrogenase Mo-binding subunit